MMTLTSLAVRLTLMNGTDYLHLSLHETSITFAVRSAALVKLLLYYAVIPIIGASESKFV